MQKLTPHRLYDLWHYQCAQNELCRQRTVEDRLPSGWTVQEVSHAGRYDPVNSRVRWGPFYDAGERELYYEVRPSQIAPGSFYFAGVGSFDGVNTSIAGSRIVVVGATGQPLRFASLGMDAGRPYFTLTGERSMGYVIQYSTNLTTWAVLQTITNDSAGTYVFRPTNAEAFAQRYFRFMPER